MRLILLFVFLLTASSSLIAQSLEIMPGTERLFADVQWLKPLDNNKRFSIFSRTRATVDYDNNTNLFTGAYLNYTSSKGIGTSLVGRISSLGSGGDVGVHYFKANKSWMLFALASVEISDMFAWSWFSILR